MAGLMRRKTSFWNKCCYCVFRFLNVVKLTFHKSGISTSSHFQKVRHYPSWNGSSDPLNHLFSYGNYPQKKKDLLPADATMWLCGTYHIEPIIDSLNLHFQRSHIRRSPVRTNYVNLFPGGLAYASSWITEQGVTADDSKSALRFFASICVRRSSMLLLSI